MVLLKPVKNNDRKENHLLFISLKADSVKTYLLTIHILNVAIVFSTLGDKVLVLPTRLTVLLSFPCTLDLGRDAGNAMESV